MYLLRLSLIILTTLIFIILAMIGMLVGNKDTFNYFARLWSKTLLKISSIKVEVIGKENIPKETGYIVCSNHASLFDIPILLSLFEYSVLIIYKKELEKIPIFGMGLKASPFVGIVREDPRKSMESLEEAASLIRNGTTILIFPEGTRSTDGKLGEFKRGAMLLAFKAGKNILPISLIGTEKILPAGKSKFSSGKVKVAISQMIDIPERADKKQEQAIIADLKETIQKGLNQ